MFMSILGALLAALLVIVLGLIVYGTMIYNGLVGLKNNIDKAWSNIDVLLKQRFDELPKLVKVCEGYMKHERNTLEAVTKARSLLAGAKTETEVMGAQNAVTSALKTLFALV